jgi:PEP-CTERM motif
MMKKTILATLLVSAAFPVAANATVLTFDGDICNNGSPNSACSDGLLIEQGYGDTASVDVQWRYDSTAAATAANGFRFWAANYNELVNVGYGTSTNNAASVFFAPLSGLSVTLNSFSLGAWPNRIGASSQYTIVDGLGATLFSSGPIVIGATGNLSSTFNVNLTSANGIGILFGPESYNVGIDNIDFTVGDGTPGPVPEPSTWAMMIGGFGMIGGALRYRRRRTRISFG